MKALALDSSSAAITFASINTDGTECPKTALLTLDIGMHQSEKLIQGIDSVLEHCGLSAAELDFTALCAGPGTFTGLRLAFSALKALNLAYGIPTYAIPTLEAIAYQYRQWRGAVIPVLDAKKQSFYAAVYRYGELHAGPFDACVKTVLDHTDPEEHILAAGTDAPHFAEQARAISPERHISTFVPFGDSALLPTGGACRAYSTALSLLELAAKKFAAKEKPLAEYEGPFYIRKSEAELSLAEQTGKHT